MIEKSSGGRKKAAISWSSGKDSCYALYRLLNAGIYDFKYLVTTVTSNYGRVSMHGVREELLEKQSNSLGIPILRVEIPKNCTNEAYEKKMSEAVERLKSEGIEYIVFGDLYLEDIKEYRESKLKGTGIEPLFPLWGEDTKDLAEKIIKSGLKAKITCIDPSRVSADFAGKDFDNKFLAELPETVDPCGENGEFHTFVFDAPIFKNPLKIITGKLVERDGFVFTDLVPD